MDYFGEYWPSSMCDGGTQIPTPVGEACAWCTVPIEAGDRGVVIPMLHEITMPSRVHWHRECFMRSTMGPVAHQRGQCRCYGVDEPPEPQTPAERRADAIALWQHYKMDLWLDEDRGVSAAVIVSQGRVLLVRRRISEGRLSWQFPAGKIKLGETIENAAVRETREETGLTVTAMKLLGERMHPDTSRQMAYVACDVLTGTAHVASPDELADVAWVPLSDIPKYVPYGLFKPVQRYLDNVLST